MNNNNRIPSKEKFHVGKGYDSETFFDKTIT